MPLVDLTLPLTHQMPVYPGDPEVEIVEIHTLDKEGWRLRQMTLTTHIGTHVNVPSHMVSKGKTLDKYPLERFMGKAELFTKETEWDKDIGLVFSEQNLTPDIFKILVNHPPKFVGLSNEFEFDIELEKKLLEQGVISFENLFNTKQLPTTFEFFGMPLNLPGADGSPVRAFALVA